MNAIVESPNYEDRLMALEELIADKRRVLANRDKWELSWCEMESSREH